jgi:hypothetical protein
LNRQSAKVAKPEILVERSKAPGGAKTTQNDEDDPRVK